jgi:peptidoglycan/LPS O-acetylase OafA/YrhL
MPGPSDAPAPRLFFLDWLRVLAFGLLVPYHVGMLYVSWDWHVKSPAAGPAIEPLMMLTAPWRLGLLFFVAGAALQSAAAHGLGPGFVRRRSWRLLWPLVFGMFVVVPPQAYFEVVDKLGYAGSYLDFMQLYVQGYGGFCRGSDCLRLPTWNHLWFLPYLWVYGLAGWLLLRQAPAALDRLAAAFARCRPWQLLVLLALPLMAARLLVGRFPSTHAFIDDVYNHLQYLSVFLLGLLAARGGPAVWALMQRCRWPALGLALLGWALVASYFQAYAQAAPPEPLRVAQRLLYGGLQWWALVAACGFASCWLDHDHAALRWLTPAVFCVYILHQTLIILLHRVLLPLQWSPALEGGVIVVLCLVLSLAGYELLRRVPGLRTAFGIMPR